MAQTLVSSSLLKESKSQESSPDYFPSMKRSSSFKISPIPIIYRKVQNDKRMRTKLAVSGYKNFSKLSACGEDTNLTLGNILKSKNIKCVRNLEFDPYLCDKSEMKPLTKALKKFKNLQRLTLVIRRLDYVNESDILIPHMQRLTKIKKIRLELSKVLNLDDNGMIKLARISGKLYSVREFEQIQIGMDHISQFASMHFKKYVSNLKFCKKYKKVSQRSNDIQRNEKHIQKVEAITQKSRCLFNMKDMTFHFFMPQEWLSMSMEPDESASVNLKALSAQKYLERLHLQCSGNPMTLETVQALSEALPTLASLRIFHLGLLNSRVSETEVVLFAQILPRLKTLERLYFQVVQYPNVSEGCIFYLMNVVSRLPNIKHFEIYFRRMDTSSDLIQEMLNRIRSLENIECSYSKQSLTFSRTEKNSES